MDEQGQQEGVADAAPAVFFSYSRVDLERARPVIALLEQHGIPVWWDGMLEAGVRYVEQTESALEGARAVVVAWTANSVASHWVRDEAMSGRDSQRLVPITLDGTLPPLGFRQFQVLDFARWAGDPEAPVARELVRAVTALQDGTAPVADWRTTTPAPQAPRGLLANRRQALVAAGLGAGVIVAGGLAWKVLLVDGGDASSNSIAVLPFSNDSNDAAQDYLAAGLASELRQRLARNPALQIVARSSSEVVARRGLDAVSAARELGVDFIVEGSSVMAEGLVRVSSDLIDGETGLGRWSQTFAKSFDNLLELQSDLAEEISTALSLQVSQAEGQLQLGMATVPAAYDQYLRAWNLFGRSGDESSNLEVLRLFEDSARLDPGFAGARSGMAAARLNLGHGAQSAEDAARFYAGAVVAAREAVELGPDLDEAWSVLAQTLFEAQLKIADAAEPFARSLELGAGTAGIQARYAEYAALTGDDAAASAAAPVATRLDPLNPVMFKTAALVHYAARRFADTIAQQRRALELDPAISGSHWWIGCALLGQGETRGALAEFEAEPSQLLGRTGLAVTHALLGNQPAADAALTALVDGYGDASAYQQAQIATQWGDAETAMRHLEIAARLGDGGLTYLNMDPLLDPLRGRADFIGLQGRLGFA